ncbi:MAG: TrbC/VirB2 family protein [Candidatus Peribacteraceae bacterium]|nr:TrbC/VirB2 family protein [Candidatus Peribacteraceae bacterium]
MKTSLARCSAWISNGILLSAISVQNALAVDLGEIPDTGGGTDIHQGLTNLIEKVLTFLGIIAVIVIVIAGIRLIVGGSDEGAREKARNAILYAIIGLIVILLAGAIVRWVADNF